MYKAYETVLYFRALAYNTYLFKGENSKEHKKSQRNVLYCICMSGEKQSLLVIRKSQNPCCFKGVKKLPVEFYANKTSWMTTVIFNDWLHKWDDKLKQYILLLVDICTAHFVNVTNEAY